MKTTDQTSDRITATQPLDTRWYRVRPALRWTLAASIAAWLGVASEGVVRFVESQDFLETAPQLVAQNASPVLNVLALVSVAAVFVERARTTGGLRKVRRRLVRSMRVTQRLIHSSRTARV